MRRTKLLEDTFTYKNVPFIVQVEESDMYVNPEKGEIRGVNMYGAPTGKKTARGPWRVCRIIVARVCPDYPYTVRKEWPENVDQHFKSYEPLEWPQKKKGWIFSKWVVEDREQEREAEELAEDAIEKLKNAYENQQEVKTL